MSNTAIIRITAEAEEDGGVEWLIRQDDGRLSSGRAPLEELSERLQGVPTTVLVPASTVLLTHAAVPPTSQQRLRRAIPYILEEQLTEDVEGLHFALGTPQADGTVPVAVVEKALMESWLARLEAADIRPRCLLPEPLALPWQAGQWSLLLDEQRVLLRHAAYAGYELPVEAAPQLLEHTLQALSPAPERLRLIDARAEADDSAVQPFVSIEGDWQSQRQLPLQAFAEGLAASAKPLNLLQGEFSRQEQLSRQLRPWIPAAAMLLVWLAVQAGLMLHERFSLVAQDQALSAQIEQVYKTAFPQAKNTQNARQKMESQLRSLKGGQSEQGFIHLMAVTGPVLGRTKGLELNTLRYKQDGLILDMALDELQTLDKLKASLLEQGLTVEIENASSRDGKVESRLVVRGGAA